MLDLENFEDIHPRLKGLSYPDLSQWDGWNDMDD